jgi:hypothetical protein
MKIQISKTWKFIPIVLAGFLGMVCVTSPVMAQVTLSDQNTTIHITTNSSAGMDNWTTDGQNVLDQQWFWYRVGPSGGQSALNTLPSTYNQFSPGFVQASFTGATFLVTANLSLLGSSPGSGTSDLSLQFSV